MNKNKGLVSVVIPTYQHAGTIQACIDSVLAQSYKKIEVIVVNDGSTDNTEDVLATYGERIIAIHQKNQGSNPARNRGFAEASGEFIIFVDADVFMKPEMIATMVEKLEQHPEASFVYSSFKFGWKLFSSRPFSEQTLKKMNYVHTTSLVRREDFPGFDNEIKRLQDWDVWLTMIESGKKGVWIDDVLFFVQIDGASRIGSSWLPSFMYKIPWHMIGWKPLQIKKYEDARQIIQRKHNL